jgi:hypothetical protein
VLSSLSHAGSRLRRSLLTLASALTLVLAGASVASAADGIASPGVVIPGSAMAVGVSGAPGKAGSFSARFSAVGTPLFSGPDTSTMNDGSAAAFALNTPSGLYSGQTRNSVDNVPFTQTQAPELTGTGTAGDPYVVVSTYDANSGVHITQTVTHVSGTTRFTTTWAVTNGTGSPSNFQGFVGGDTYAAGNDSGTGTLSGPAPNRVIGSVAPDGTQTQIVEQSGSPVTRYFSGDPASYYLATGDSTFGDMPNLIDATNRDAGLGAQWNITLANGATKTLSIVWNFSRPSLAQAPQITGGLPAQGGLTTADTANVSFAPATGDSANALGFQCAVDGGTFSACTSPLAVGRLADGSHTFSVRATNSAGEPGPQTTRSFTVDTFAPGPPTLTEAPSGPTRSGSATVRFTGESDATFRCAVDGGSYVACTSPVTISGLSDGPHTFSVRQTDAAGNQGTAVASAAWKVDTVAPAVPTVTGAPTGTVATDEATLTLGGEADATFRCSVDGGPFVVCTSPLELRGLADGGHDVRVRQADEAGNVGDATDAIAWTVDTAVPAAPAASQPQDSTATTARVTFEVPAGSTAECSLDGGAYQACASPLTVSDLAVGQHQLRVRMVNAAGTPGAPQTIVWEVRAPAAATPQPAGATPGTTPPAAAPAAGAAPSPATIAPAPACVSRRVITVHWKLPKGARARGFEVLVGGKVVQRLKGTSRAAKVNLAGRGAGAVRVVIRTTGRGPALAVTRVFRTCVRKSASTAGQPSMVLKRVR